MVWLWVQVWADLPPWCFRASSCLALSPWQWTERRREGVTTKGQAGEYATRGEKTFGVDWPVGVRRKELYQNKQEQKDPRFWRNIIALILIFFLFILCPCCLCTMLSSVAMLFLCLHQTVWAQQQTGESHLFFKHDPFPVIPNSVDRWPRSFSQHLHTFACHWLHALGSLCSYSVLLYHTVTPGYGLSL